MAQAKHAELVHALLQEAGEGHRQIAPDRRAPLSGTSEDLRRLGYGLWRDRDAANARSLQRRLLESARRLPDLHQRVESIRETLGLQIGDMSLRRAQQLAELAGLAGSPHRPEPEWLDPSVQDALDRAAKVLSELVTEYRDRESALADVFTPEVLDLDLPELERRFRDEHKGLRKWGAAYRTDKRTLAAVSRSGKADKAVRGRLGEAREWQLLSQRLQQAEGQHAGVLGSGYYQRTSTDFGAVVAAVEVAKRAVQLLGRDVHGGAVAARLSRAGRPDFFLAQDAAALLDDLTSWEAELRDALSKAPPDVPLTELEEWCRAVARHVGDLAEHGEHVEAVVGRPLPLVVTQDLIERRRALQDLEEANSPDDQVLRRLLGPRYDGVHTEADVLRDDLAWATRLRQLLGGPVNDRTARSVLVAKPDAAAVQSAWQRWEKLRDELLGLFEPPRARDLQPELDGTYDDVAELLDDLLRTTSDIDEWKTYRETLRALDDKGLRETVDDLARARIPATQVQQAVEGAVLEAHVDHLLDTDERLSTYRSADRDHLVHEYQALDRKLLAGAAATVINAVNNRRPRTATGVAGILVREAQKKTRHMPVRRLLAETAPVTQRLKPCFMMSPLTVSQFLTSELSFDVVIFDEASQVLPADAVNCIYRAQQVIVAGDQKQLPPTSFFMGTTADDGDDYDEDQLDEFESVLDLCKGSGGFPSLPLLWHYRSQHESLITFSNYSFYDGKLVTFPGALEKSEDVGVQFVHVADGTYRRGGPRDNPREALVVVDRVLDHARRHPDLTWGVVAFSEAQAAAIELELERRRKSAPELDGYFAGDRLDGFFVKNLENVQGDERDIIVFSIGYGPDENQKTTMNFGPVNRGGGWRRLNVAATCARRRVEVISSITAGDIHGTSNESVLHLKRYLDFADRGMPALAVDLEESQGGADSPFEEEVTAVLRRWGYDVVPQVGSAGYRIDMAVRHPERPGSFALGIECDGVMYHSSKVARDRDRLREEVLRGLGWRLHRIWGTAWYRDRAREEERLHEAVREAIAGHARSGQDRGPQPARTEVLVEDVELGEQPEWIRPYVVSRPVARRTGYEITEPQSQPDLVRVVQQVVKEEGPLHRERLVRRVREAFGVGRTGAKVRAVIDEAVDRCVRERSVEVRSEFLGAPGGWHSAVRVPDPADEGSRRKVEEVPPDELRLALQLYVGDAHAIDREALLVAVARLFGWGRLGPDIRYALEDALEDAVSAGQLVEQGGQVQLTV